MTAIGAPVAGATAAREASTGMATGKTPAPAAASAAGQSDAAAAAPKVGDTAAFTVTYRESPTRASTGKVSWGCATGEHIKQAVLTAQGNRYEMQDVIVTSCSTANGQRTKELTGHVTLIK